MKQARRLLGMVCIGLLLIAVGFGLRGKLMKALLEQQRAHAEAARAKALQEQAGKLLNAVHADPKAAEPRRALADFYQEQRLMDKALEQRILIANLNPNNIDDRIHVGTTLIALHSYPEAEGVYRYITRHWPQNIAGWQGLSTALYHQKRYLEAWQAG